MVYKRKEIAINWIKQVKQSTNGIVLFGLSANKIKQRLLISSYKGEIIVKKILEDATKASIDIAKEKQIQKAYYYLQPVQVLINIKTTKKEEITSKN